MNAHAVCAVFDMDDTLYLERDYVRSGFQAVGRLARERLRIDDFGELAWSRFEQGQRTKIFDAVLQECSRPADDSIIAEFVALYRSHQPEIRLAEDVPGVLAALRIHANLALITDGFPETQRRKMDALGLHEWFDVLIVTDELGVEHRKPHPRAFDEVASLYPRANSFVYVGDNPAKDFQAPYAKGWKSIRIRRPLGLHASVENPVPPVDAQIKDFSELSSAIFSPERLA